jgi:hypothetical protein
MERPQAARYRLVQRLGDDFDGMLHAVEALAGDSAGSQRHQGTEYHASLFVRHHAIELSKIGAASSGPR